MSGLLIFKSALRNWSDANNLIYWLFRNPPIFYRERHLLYIYPISKSMSLGTVCYKPIATFPIVTPRPQWEWAVWYTMRACTSQMVSVIGHLIGRSRISNFESRISNFEFRISNFEFRISNFEFRMSLLGFRSNETSSYGFIDKCLHNM